MKNAAAIPRAVRGSDLAPLTNEQKATICIFAADAYEKVGKRTGQSLEDWRHEQQDIACGHASLCTATQKDYLNLKGHFKSLLGYQRSAFKDFVKSETSDSGYVLAKLRHECRAAGDVIERPEDYIKSIARSRFKTVDLKSLSSKQLWSLVFDIRRNAQRRRRKAA